MPNQQGRRIENCSLLEARFKRTENEREPAGWLIIEHLLKRDDVRVRR
jgi:hypothetical protein